MKKLLHILKHEHTLDQYNSSADLMNMIEAHKIDGFEIICCGEENSGKIPSEKIIGYHMSFYSYWIDMWNFNPHKLIEEYGDAKTCMEFYGINYDDFVNKFGIEFWKYKADGKTPLHGKLIYDVQEFVRDHIVKNFKKDCDHAQELGAAYVVFHVSNVNTYEIFSYNFTNIDRTIIDASIEIINKILDGSSYSFEFLFENLWWSGLNFLNPRDTVHLFENINYKNKGFMLDTGHLMNSNLDLISGEDALEYLHGVIKLYDGIFEIKKHIRGMHLHQSLSGQYVKNSIKLHPFEATGDSELGYYEKFALLYDYVMNIDTHSPMVFDGTLEFIDSISPEYLVFEITKSNRSELEPLLALQNTIFDYSTQN